MDDSSGVHQETQRTVKLIVGVVLVALVFVVVYDPFSRDVAGQAYAGAGQECPPEKEGKLFLSTDADGNLDPNGVGKCVNGVYQDCSENGYCP